MTTAIIIANAVEKFGSERKLADSVGCSQAQIHKLKKGGVVTANFAVMFERATGVSRHKLRPDLWPSPIKRQ
jgi:DNA-binding transcriptional regulator YdaS (Cro superfamily)